MARMFKTIFIWSGVAAVACLVAFIGWIASLPAAQVRVEAPAVPADDASELLRAFRPESSKRPLVAVIGLNDATETTDYLLPAGALRRADVADVVLLSTRPGFVTLYPALSAAPDATIAAFDADHPSGADYVIVPAMSRDDDPSVMV